MMRLTVDGRFHVKVHASNPHCVHEPSIGIGNRWDVECIATLFGPWEMWRNPG